MLQSTVGRLFVTQMQTRAHLRLVGLADPGVLTGWAPSGQLATTVALRVRDLAEPISVSLRAGVAFGLHEVRRVADVGQVRLHTEWTQGLHDVADDQAVQIVVADQDPPPARALDTTTSIYTCPLEEWRPEAWSVACAPASTWPPTQEWHPALSRHGAASLNERFLQATGQPMDAAAWRGWMAVQAAYGIALRRAAGEDDVLALTFDGHKGQPLRFGDDGHLVQPTYRLGPDRRLVVVAPRLADFEH